MANRSAASTKSVAAKLLLKPGMRVTVLDAPAGVDGSLGELPAGVTLSNRAGRGADALIVFATTRKGLERRIASLDGADPATMLWVAYPKQTSKAESDLNRDVLRAFMGEHGLDAVSLIALDDTWSVMRFKRRSE